MKEVYLDNLSNARIDPRVLEEMLPFLRESYGNAQSMHTLGSKSREALDQARERVAGLIGAETEEIYFTSCGSEANNLAVKGTAEAYRQKRKHIVVSGVEHFSVLYSARRLAQAGFEITHLPVDQSGLISAEEVRKAVRDDTVLVSIQHANPEIGTIQPIEEFVRIAHAKGALFHTDAVCTAGLLPIEVKALEADLLTFSSSPISGPPGTAALYLKKGVRVIPQIDGGIQENGRRAGTENLPGIVGFGRACEIARSEREDNYRKLSDLSRRLIAELPAKIEYVYLNGHPTQRIPNNVNFSVEFIEGEAMLLFLDQKGIYISSGSACASKALKMSHVLTAIDVDPAVGQGSILFALSRSNTDADIDYVLSEFPPIVKRLREMSPLWAYFLKTGERKPAGPGTDYEHEHDHEHGD